MDRPSVIQAQELEWKTSLGGLNILEGLDGFMLDRELHARDLEN